MKVEVSEYLNRAHMGGVGAVLELVDEHIFELLLKASLALARIDGLAPCGQGELAGEFSQIADKATEEFKKYVKEIKVTKSGHCPPDCCHTFLHDCKKSGLHCAKHCTCDCTECNDEDGQKVRGQPIE